MAQKTKKMTKKELARELTALKAEIASLKTEMALKAEIASLKTEMAHLRTEQRVKLKDEIDNLHKKMYAELETLKAAAGPKREEKRDQGESPSP